MAVWYAQADASWASAQWNDQADGLGNSGSPADGDTCDANGHGVSLGTDTIPDHITLTGTFVANLSRAIGTGTSHCQVTSGSIVVGYGATLRWEAFCLSYAVNITVQSGGTLNFLGSIYGGSIANEAGGTVNYYPEATLSNAGSLSVLGLAVGVGAIPAASDVRYGEAVGSTTGTCRVPSAENTAEGVAVDVSGTGTFTHTSAYQAKTLSVLIAAIDAEIVKLGEIIEPTVTGGDYITGTYEASGGGATAEEVAAAVFNFNCNGQTAQARLESIVTLAQVEARTLPTADYATSDKLAEAKTVLDGLPAATNTALGAAHGTGPWLSADVSGLATSEHLSVGLVSLADGIVLVKERTDLIPDEPAATGDLMGLADGAITSAKFTVGEITGPASGLLEQIRQLWRRFFAKVSVTDSALDTYADDGTTPITTQAVSDDGITQTVGAAEAVE